MGVYVAIYAALGLLTDGLDYSIKSDPQSVVLFLHHRRHTSSVFGEARRLTSSGGETQRFFGFAKVVLPFPGYFRERHVHGTHRQEFADSIEDYPISDSAIESGIIQAGTNRTRVLLGASASLQCGAV